MSIDTPRSAATSGSRPMMTNSLVPMPKAAAASAMRCKGMERAGKGAALGKGLAAWETHEF